jgi:hypothetical protein
MDNQRQEQLDQLFSLLKGKQPMVRIISQGSNSFGDQVVCVEVKGYRFDVVNPEGSWQSIEQIKLDVKERFNQQGVSI